MKLLTFNALVKKHKMKIGSKELAMRADLSLFARLTVLAQSRFMSMKLVLSYPLGPIPWSIAIADGGLVKTDKASLLHLLEDIDDKCILPELPSKAVFILDGMALLQSFPGLNVGSKFKDLASALLHRIVTKQHALSGRIDVVFDCYPEVSIKGAERQRRSSARGFPITIASGDQKCPRSWSDFLKVGSNKEEIVRFLVEEWQSDVYVSVLNNCHLFVTEGENCWEFFVHSGKMLRILIPGLQCSQEEADTRMFFHASHVAKWYPEDTITVVIKSPDTDVAVLGVSLADKLPCDIVLYTGTKHRTRFISLSCIARTLGSSALGLLGMHAVTGCDTVSAFKCKGKKKAFQLLRSGDYADSLSELGSTFDVTEDLFSKVQKFVCALYGKANLRSVNDARYRLFCSKSCMSSMLPPCEDALRLHANRANYQSAIWRRSLEADPQTPSPVEHGWEMSEGALSIKWLCNAPAPTELLQMVSCGCKTGCSTASCSCKSNSMRCTDACQCGDSAPCQNGNIAAFDVENADGNVSNFPNDELSNDEEDDSDVEIYE